MDDDLTFCIGFRSWNPDHLRRCLASLTPFGQPIIVTIGDEHLPDWCASNGRVMDGPATWIHRPMPVWSRAVALNHAARTAETPFTVLTDADMLFPAHWLPAARRMIPTFRLLLTDSRDLDQKMTEGWEHLRGARWFVSDDARLETVSIPHDRVGQGAATVVSREWFLDVGGFDETYKIWGSEDNDLVMRARWDGLVVRWIPNTFVVHQWHPIEATEDQWAQVVKNRVYLYERMAEGGPIVRNR